MKKIFTLILCVSTIFAYAQNGNIHAEDELYVGDGTPVSNTWGMGHFQNAAAGAGSALFLQTANSGYNATDGVQISLTGEATNADFSIFNREGGDFRYSVPLSLFISDPLFTVKASSGFVGIGTLSPAKNLDLADTGADIRFSNSDFSAIQWYSGGTEKAYLTHNEDDIFLHNRDTGNLNLYSENGRMRMSPSGDATIGTDIGAPTFELTEGSAGASRHGIIELNNYNFAATNKRAILIDTDGSANEPFIQMYTNDGSIGISLDVDVSGDSRITTDELVINGGADFAENFDIIGEDFVPQPGMVVSIDANSTGKLTIADNKYDRKVAGIISGANGVEPGLMMGQLGSIADGEYPVALTGRVFVYTNTENGKIVPGDLLTTSSQKGYAMKVNDFGKAQGAILGKAMTEVDENGFVLVLVNLQ